MKNKLLQKMAPYAQGKYILIGFGLMVFINAIAFPWTIEKIKETAPDAAVPIDLKFSYSPDEVYQMVESYGKKGRAIYMKSVLGIDMPYPLIYTITSILMLLLLMKKLFPEGSRVHQWALLPVITFFADIFENTGIILMLKNFPEKLDSVAQMTSIFSSIKWSFVGVMLLLMLALWIKTLFSKNK